MADPRRRIGPGWRDIIIAVLITFLGTTLTGWVSFGRDVPRRDEVSRLQVAVDRLSDNVASLTTSVAVLSERVKDKDKEKAP